jgi:hypothetical protein
MKRAWLAGAIILSAACAPGARAQSGEQVGVAGGDLPPAGYGTMNQDDIAIRLTAGDIDVRLIPLDQRVLRLLANDAYESLNKLVKDRQPSIDSVASLAGTSDPGLALVSFFGRRDGARFEPLNVFITSRGQLFQPIGMVPFSATIYNRQIDARQQATAIIVYPNRIPVLELFGVTYGVTVVADAWSGALSRVQRERVKVMTKARAQQADSTRAP